MPNDTFEHEDLAPSNENWGLIEYEGHRIVDFTSDSDEAHNSVEAFFKSFLHAETFPDNSQVSLNIYPDPDKIWKFEGDCTIAPTGYDTVYKMDATAMRRFFKTFGFKNFFMAKYQDSQEFQSFMNELIRANLSKFTFYLMGDTIYDSCFQFDLEDQPEMFNSFSTFFDVSDTLDFVVFDEYHGDKANFDFSIIRKENLSKKGWVQYALIKGAFSGKIKLIPCFLNTETNMKIILPFDEDVSSASDVVIDDETSLNHFLNHIDSDCSSLMFKLMNGLLTKPKYNLAKCLTESWVEPSEKTLRNIIDIWNPVYNSWNGSYTKQGAVSKMLGVLVGHLIHECKDCGFVCKEHWANS